MTGVKRELADFAINGGRPAFDSPLPVGQLHFPNWERYEQAIRGICEREWYTNHGPLAVETELRLAAFLGVRNVVCVSNATVGLMMAIKALELDRVVVLPAVTSIATAQALVWAGAEPRFCDVDAGAPHVSAETVEAALDDGVHAIVGVNLWGDVCDVTGLMALARGRGVHLLFDSAQAFGCAIAGRRLGGFGELEVFSFHQANVINAAEGGCVATDDDELAARLRNIRSSYGAGRPVPVPITSNGRFSEAQAALTLLALDDYQTNVERNRSQVEVYADGTAEIAGLRLIRPSRVDDSNHQSAVLAIDSHAFGLQRDQLMRVLGAERIDVTRPYARGLHRTAPFESGPGPALPHAEELCATVLELPLGAAVDEHDIASIVALIGDIHRYAGQLSATV